MRRVSVTTDTQLTRLYKTITGWIVARYETKYYNRRRILWQAKKDEYCLQCSNENDLLLSIDKLEDMENGTKVCKEI